MDEKNMNLINKEVKLDVNNLTISFRTDAGKVQAVRNISFKLHKGETLAIVGESGSGKSVTNRAIIGILAGNAIKEGGEIIYDGQDLMKISEEEFHTIRGDKIAMIFQDPMSSLNPIMRVGKQLTEAMLIKGRVSQKRSRKDFNTMLALLNENMDLSRGEATKQENKELCANFDKFEYKHIELELAYNNAVEAAKEALDDIDDIIFRIEKNAVDQVVHDVIEAMKEASSTFNPYVVSEREEELKSVLAHIKEIAKIPMSYYVKKVGNVLRNRQNAQVDIKADFEGIAEDLRKIKEILTEAVAKPEPNFFSMGYYLTFAQEPLPDMPVPELNAYLHEYLDEHFMLGFIDKAQVAIKYAFDASLEKKREAVKVMKEGVEFFKSETLDKKATAAETKTIIKAVEDAINRLDIVKDNLAYTLHSSLESAVNIYFNGIKSNEKEEKRYARQLSKYNAIVAKGKTPNYEVAGKNLVDLESAKKDIINVITRVIEDFEGKIANTDGIDFNKKAVGMIDYLKEKASGVVYKVTKRMAKMRAIKLLEEVGIPEPRKRYRQYPFEFSGGMRQRIVIAIALSANPDILICDEPTTALDVTIQSQILELINKVKKERNLSVIFITHNLGVVANMADRVAVMYAGKIVEIGTANDVFYSPAHPYTWALLSAMPDLDTKDKLETIPGTPPNMIYPPKGDAFADRNKYAMKIDFEKQPPMFKVSDTHYAATWLLHPDAPKVEPPKSVTDRINRMRKSAGGQQ